MQKAQQLKRMYCPVGFLGVDCSIDASLPPVITGTRTGPVCDARGPNPCIFVSIFVTNFAFIDTFSCRFVRMTSQLVVFGISNYWSRSRSTYACRISAQSWAIWVDKILSSFVGIFTVRAQKRLWVCEFILTYFFSSYRPFMALNDL